MENVTTSISKMAQWWGYSSKKQTMAWYTHCTMLIKKMHWCPRYITTASMVCCSVNILSYLLDLRSQSGFLFTPHVFKINGSAHQFYAAIELTRRLKTLVVVCIFFLSCSFHIKSYIRKVLLKYRWIRHFMEYKFHDIWEIFGPKCLTLVHFSYPKIIFIFRRNVTTISIIFSQNSNSVYL